MLDSTVKVNGSKIDDRDLTSLLGGHKVDEDNYLTNFVIYEYLNLLSESSPEGLKVQSINYEKFEKGYS